MKQYNYKCIVTKNGVKMYYKRVKNKWKRISNTIGMKAEKGKRKYNPPFKIQDYFKKLGDNVTMIEYPELKNPLDTKYNGDMCLLLDESNSDQYHGIIQQKNKDFWEYIQTHVSGRIQNNNIHLYILRGSSRCITDANVEEIAKQMESNSILLILSCEKSRVIKKLNKEYVGKSKYFTGFDRNVHPIIENNELIIIACPHGKGSPKVEIIDKDRCKEEKLV